MGRSRYDPIESRPLRFPGRWYDPSSLYPAGMNSVKSRKQVNTIQLIMETSWGVQRSHEQKCTLCAKRGYECWVFTEPAIEMVKYGTLSCARCRANPQRCSLNPPRVNLPRVISRTRSPLPMSQTPRIQSLRPRHNADGHEQPHPLMTNNSYTGNSSTGIRTNVGQGRLYNMHQYQQGQAET